MLLKKIKIIFLLLIVFYGQRVFGQEVDLSKITIAPTAQFISYSGEMKHYWKSTIGGGVQVKYQVSDKFFLETGLLFFRINTKSNNLNLPKISLINLPAGIKLFVPMSRRIGINIFSGLQDNTFIFSGGNIEEAEENNVEHEFGVFISLGIEINLFSDFIIELNSKAQTIFSSPEQIQTYYLGINLFIDE